MTTATKPHELLYEQDEIVAAWVSERIPDVREHGFTEGAAIGVLSQDGKRLIAGVVYTDYQPECGTIQLHIASDGPMWARRSTIRELLAYPFYQLDIFKCWVLIPSDNEKSLKATKHIGFEVDGELEHHFGKNRHGIIKKMFKPDFERLYIQAKDGHQHSKEGIEYHGKIST
jgi:RimJ/RimL family protein N-acetyltransferase